MSDYELKKLTDLKVVELKHELEKRGLDKSGVKQFLIESLREAMLEEGKNPTSHLFEVVDKKAKRSSVTSIKEEKIDKAADTKGSVESAAPQVQEEKADTEKEKQKEQEKDADKAAEADVKREKEPAKEPTPVAQVEESANAAELDLDGDGQDESIRLTLEDEEALHDDEADNLENNPPEKPLESRTDEDKNICKEVTTASDAGTKSATATTTHEAANNKDGKDATALGSSGGGANSSTSDSGAQKVSTKSNPKVVWISNITQNTRANELKKALSVCGKVNGAKIVVNARYPRTCCFGYVTMASVEDVDNVIAKLNNTELNGQIIKIEKFDDVRAEKMRQIRGDARGRADDDKTNTKSSTASRQKSPDKDKKDERNKNAPGKRDEDKAATDIEKKNERKDSTSSKDEKKENTRKSDTAKDKKDVKSGSVSRSVERRTSLTSSGSRERRHSNSREKVPERKHIGQSRTRHHPDLLTFDKIREERERQRLREKERLLREESRRRHEEALRQREVERRQRSEAARLEREREKLRQERDKIEREKAELIRMERERTRLEREKLAAEKMELARTLIRLEEDRRAAKRPAPYTGRRDENYDDRKRPATGERHYEETPPPPPRFEPPASVKSREPSPKKFSSSKDYKSRITFDSKHDSSSYSDKRGAGGSSAGGGGGGGGGSSRDYDVDSRAIGRGGSGNKYERPFERERNDPRSREVPSVRSKDRYIERGERERERDRSPHFRSVREEERSNNRRTIAETKAAEMNAMVRDRYSDTSNGKEPVRFDRNSNNWSGIQSSAPKNFSGGSNPKPWVKDNWRSESSNSERWNNSGPSGRSMNQSFSGSSNSGMTPVCPPPPGINNYTDRFDYNKSMNSGSLRKY